MDSDTSDDLKPQTCFIVEPKNTDVLLGRGRRSFHHQGNQIYRKMISDSIVEYGQATNKLTKTCIIQNIVRSINQKGNKFLKFNSAKGYYYQVSDKVAHEKTSQAFRDAMYNNEQKLNERSFESFSESETEIQRQSSLLLNMIKEREMDLDVENTTIMKTSIKRIGMRNYSSVTIPLESLDTDDKSSGVINNAMFNTPAVTPALHVSPRLEGHKNNMSSTGVASDEIKSSSFETVHEEYS